MVTDEGFVEITEEFSMFGLSSTQGKRARKRGFLCRKVA